MDSIILEQCKVLLFSQSSRKLGPEQVLVISKLLVQTSNNNFNDDVDDGYDYDDDYELAPLPPVSWRVHTQGKQGGLPAASHDSGHACKSAHGSRTHRVLQLGGSMEAKFTNGHGCSCV
jgi:hypothetical protein